MSPRIYNYLQIYLEFFSNEPPNEGPHVHAISRDEKRGIKILFDINKEGFPEKWVPIKELEELRPVELRLAKEIIDDMKSDILKKWIDFRSGKKIKQVTITRRIK